MNYFTKHMKNILFQTEKKIATSLKSALSTFTTKNESDAEQTKSTGYSFCCWNICE